MTIKPDVKPFNVAGDDHDAKTVPVDAEAGLCPNSKSYQLSTPISCPTKTPGTPDVPDIRPMPERGQWKNEYDFLFSCISVSVGLGNVWRFPYLCFKNGGGTFLLVYFVAMLFCGVPTFFQEVAIGQYLGSGGMTLIAQLCPIFKGVGIATMFLVFFLNIYYCVIIGWTLFYLVASFVAIPNLPWDTCDAWWNTDKCFSDHLASNITQPISPTVEGHISHADRQSSVEEFWENRVLQTNSGLEHGLGSFQWELVAALFVAWILVYLIIARGLHASGKIIWFTALFPYAVMAILLVRALTLDGAIDGLYYYVSIDYEKLFVSQTWIDGATQIFFAYSVGMGALPALGSYNRFRHDCYRDAIITCVVNTLTCLLAGVLVFSILGYMAKSAGVGIADVVNSGPGLVFLTYPDLVLSLPASVLWSVIFFIMLLVLGVDSAFCNVEALITGIVDNWPNPLLKYRRIFTVAICFFMFLLGLPMCTQGGVYLFQLVDFYAASGMSLLWVCFFQTIAIGWVYGADKFCDHVTDMTGRRLNLFWFLCWKYFAPGAMMAVFIFFVLTYKPVTYGADYQYPKWAEILGLVISFTSMMWIPMYALYHVLSGPGTMMENLAAGLKPDIKPNPNRPRVSSSLSALRISDPGLVLVRSDKDESVKAKHCTVQTPSNSSTFSDYNSMSTRA